MPSRQPHDSASPHEGAGRVPLFARGIHEATSKTPTMADALQASRRAPPATTTQTATLIAPQPAPPTKKPAKVLADAPSPWPRGRLNELWPVFAEAIVALARLVSWIVAALAQLVFGFFRLVARGLGFVVGKLSGDRVRARGAEAVGWLLLVAILGVSASSLGTVSGWVINRYFGQSHKRVAVPYVPPPSACVLPRAACAAPSEYLDGQPSISATKILSVLQQYNSPAATPDFAAQLYDLGIQYGVNPAYALGFFVEESHCGTQGVAANSHSLGNIRYTDSNSPVTYGNYQGYRSYSSWRDGAEDFYWTIRTYYLNQGDRDIFDVTPIYAPSDDNNDPKQYAQTVLQLVQSWAS